MEGYWWLRRRMGMQAEREVGGGQTNTEKYE
jgi:hypothetical protein